MGGLFESLLERHEHERHGRIVASLSRRRYPDDDGRDGFLPASEAAVVMQVPEVELFQMVRRNQLEAHEIGGQVWIRPAVVRMSIGVRSNAA